MSAQTFIDALEARRGIVAVVGAGGKKSTLHRLIEAHRAIGTKRFAVTTTVKMAPAPASQNMQMLTGDADEVLETVRADRASEASILIAAPSITANRLSGMPPDVIQKIHSEGRFDVTLVKADGARMRWIKAPNDDEPLLPSGVTTILPIVSARVLGQPLSARIAYRPEKLAAVIDETMETQLTPRHLARLLVSDHGALHRVGNARVVPVINMVDEPEMLDLARKAATAALAATDRYQRIVLASMSAMSPLIEIITP
ncbi:MAG: selenium cofactor biosynthesis protein YqeC [Geminicoccaceae bacterium]